ncbi:AAA family ATPase [Nonomuraea sp. NPDC046802]|uniref:AAA family ATPase n=1 Tax=Nonomuraea sp. NPDC046802 TaxID=3154919 RepID=UPI0033DC0041
MTLVGRKDALGAVEGVLAAGAGCVVVEGPAGIGKSRLLEAAVALGRSRGMIVGVGRATELDRVAPLSTLTRSLGMLREDGSPGALEGADGFRQIERIADAVERLTRHRSLAIVLDDVQWADELTCLALRHLIPSLAASPVIWLLGRRPLPQQEAVEQLIAEGARRVVLPPLTLDECAELSGQILEAKPDASVTELARASGGNPFLLEEVLTGLRDEGRISVTDGVAAIAGAAGGMELPVRLVAAVERRLRDLSRQARRLLEVAAVLRRPFTVHEAAGMLGMPPARLFSCVEEAVGAGAVVEDGERLAFRHDLIREAVYGGLTAPIRTALHREAAAVLRAEGRPPAELAEHLRHGARLGDVAAIGELRAAAEEMTSVAPSAAADLMLRALELAGSPDTDPGDRVEPPAFQQGEHDGRGEPAQLDPGTGRVEPPQPGPDGRNRGRREAGGLDAGLVAGVVRLLASAGRLGEARRVADARGAPLSAAEEAGIVLGLAEALKHAGDDHGVIRRTGRVLGRPGVPVLERARLLAVRAHALMMTGGIDAADVAAAEAVATGEVFAQVVGLQARSTVALFRGELDDALRYAEQSVRLADAAGGEVAHRHPRLWLGAALVAVDRFEEAEAVYRVVERESGRLGTAWSLPLLHRFRAELFLSWGRLDDAAAEAEAGLRVAGQMSAMALAPALMGVLGHLALLRGEPEAARGPLERGRALAGDGPGLVAEELRWRRWLLDRRTPGDAAGGERWPANDGTLAYLIVQEPWMAARLRTEPGVVERVRELARRNPGVVSLAAGAAHAEGRLDAAIELYRAGPRPLGLAAALEEAGRREEALAIYRSCGVVVAGRRGAPGRGWEALTASELRVVRLVARGMTNREAAAELFLSPHTVDSHLRHAFAKLGVSSRVELTRQVLAHEPAD